MSFIYIQFFITFQKPENNSIQSLFNFCLNEVKMTFSRHHIYYYTCNVYIFIIIYESLQNRYNRFTGFRGIDAENYRAAKNFCNFSSTAFSAIKQSHDTFYYRNPGSIRLLNKSSPDVFFTHQESVKIIGAIT